MNTPDSTQYLSSLHKQIEQYFSLNDVRTICFDLGVDYENIPGDQKSAFIRNLILSLARQNRLQDLVNIVRKERSFVDWQDVPPDFQLPSSVAREDIQQVNHYAVYGDVVQGDKFTGDKVEGDNISVGDISNSEGIAIGRKASANFNKAQQAPLPQDPDADLENFSKYANSLEELTGVPGVEDPPPSDDSDTNSDSNASPEDSPVEDEPEANDNDETENSQEASAATETTPATLTDLAQRYGTNIHLAQTDEPWLLSVNTLVISVGVQGGMQGGLSQALRNKMGEDVWNALREQVQTAVTTITPETPVLITLDASLGPQILPHAPELPDGRENGRYQIIAATPARSNSGPFDPEAAARAIIKLAIDNNISHLAIPLLGSGRGKLNSVRVVEDMLTAIYWGLPSIGNPLKTITLTTRPGRADVVAAAQNTIHLLTANRAQKLSADSVAGEDTLGIKTEVYALAETLLLRDVETPLAVGILGGWGSGKSFAMHLMQQEMRRIRSLTVSKGWEADETEPYVGHIYPIEFNAWTYAKSDLWASLMQTIFMDLNKQLSLERLFDEDKLKAGGANWLELNQLGDQELEALLTTEVGAATVREWQLGKTPDSLWVAYHDMRVKEMAEMEAVEAARDQLELDLQQLETTQQQQIEAEARKEVWTELVGTAVTSTIAQEIQNELKNNPNISQKDLEDLTKLGIKLKQVRPTMSDLWQRRNMLHMLWQSKGIILLSILLLILPFILNGLFVGFKQLDIYPYLMSWLGSIGTALLAGFRIYQEWSERVQRWLAGINDTLKLADEMMETEETKLTTQKQAEITAKRQKLETQLDKLNAQIDRHQQRMGIASEFNTLQDFVSARLKDRDYEERLGMLHRAQTDLKELTDTLTLRGNHDLHAEAKQKFFPRGPARVVLFIDDLDRCPPHKVVEVLEAVQLLLRTELFVVVLGLDTRYVTRALEKQYAGILQHHGDPSGLDYIEKIIQIPYRVRPIEPGSLHSFLEAQMEMVVQTPEQEDDGSGVISIPLDSAEPPIHRGITKGLELEIDTGELESLTAQQPISPEPSEIPSSDVTESKEETETPEPELIPISPQKIKFHPEDLADLEHACVSLGLTPRSIKRLINVLKLMKVFWFRTNQSKNQEEIRTVINLLTLSARYPEIMVQVFHNIEMAYQNGSKGEDPLNNYLTENLVNGGVLPQMGVYETAVTHLAFNNITLNDLGLSTFHLVRSFSFVGDPVYTEAKT